MPNLPKNNTNIQLHPRLARLDDEMMQSGAVPYQYLVATHDGKKYMVCCMKNRDFDFVATVSTGHPTKNLVLRTKGCRKPSQAVREVLRQLAWNLRQPAARFHGMFARMVAK
jgi:hypothetical protein